MRNQLRPFEGQKVHYTGRLKERRDAGDHWDVCLVNVSVRPLRTDVGLNSITPVRVDHLWLRVKKATFTTRGMLEPMEGAGTCGWYRRAGDHSVDLGVRAEPSLSLDAVFSEAMAEPKRKDRARIFDSAVWAVDEVGANYWSWNKAGDEVLSAMREAMEHYSRTCALNLGALMVAPSNGPCHRLRETSRISGTKRQPARGFA